MSSESTASKSNKSERWLARKKTLRAICVSVAAGLLASCKSDDPPPPRISPLAYQIHRTQIQEQKNVSEKRHVIIEGEDIQLPLTSGKLAPQERRIYSFYVWAHHPTYSRQMSLADMWRKGYFSLEVVGAKAAIRVPDYVPMDPPAKFAPVQTNLPPEELKSRSVLEVELRSDDMIRGFSIIAWFPQDYMGHVATNPIPPIPESPSGLSTNATAISNQAAMAELALRAGNPWGERRDVKVYSGDLRTRVDIIDEKEATASFGERFARFFYVGRVYFRNRHPDKRLLVYTTSLRANALLYRPPVPKQQQQQGLTDDQLKRLAVSAQKRHQEAIRLLSEEQFQSLWTESKRVIGGEELKARNQEQWSLVAQRIATNLISQTETNWTGKRATAVKLCLAYWQGMAHTAEAWKGEAERAGSEVRETAKVQAAMLEEAARECARKGIPQEALKQAADAFKQLASAKQPERLNSAFVGVTSALARTEIADVPRNHALKTATNLRQLAGRADDCARLAAAMRTMSPEGLEGLPSHASPGGTLRNEFDAVLASIRLEAESPFRSAGPFDHRLDLMVNADARPLAFSPDADLQRQLSDVGYLWRDTCRPMTFQAVLNSLVDTHERSPATRFVRTLESAARIAGGLVGLGTVVNEFSSQGYTVGVDIYSTIVLPEIQKHLLVDLNKYVRNLGEMGMDTVMVIPPNDVVDRYVFFPKGPIYNHIDEFNVTDPAYIVRIDNDDVAVEATLIEQDVVVRGGGLDAGRLVERAINEGRAEANAELMKQVELKERLRRFELATLIPRIESALTGTVAQTNSEPKSPERLRAESLVVKLVADFELRFGSDTTGIIAGLMSKYGVAYADAAPAVNREAIPTIKVVAGVASTPFVLPVSDDQTPPDRLQVTHVSANPDRLSDGKVRVQRPDAALPGTNQPPAPITFTVQPQPNLPTDADAITTVDFTVKDEHGNSAKVAVPVVIKPPQVTMLPVSSGLRTNAQEGGFALTDASRNQVLFMELRLPIFNSQRDEWKVAAQKSDPDSRAGVGLAGPPSVREEQNQFLLLTQLRIDPSLETNDQLKFNWSVTWKDSLIVSNQFMLTLTNRNPH